MDLIITQESKILKLLYKFVKASSQFPITAVIEIRVATLGWVKKIGSIIITLVYSVCRVALS